MLNVKISIICFYKKYYSSNLGPSDDKDRLKCLGNF